MHRRFALAALATAITMVAATSAAHAITHTGDYKTNMGNYRTCTDPLLDTCDYADVLSPSLFYLPAGTTTTVIYKDDTTVQLRIDAGGILTDDGISYTCSLEPFPCIAAKCSGGRHHNESCVATTCVGGTNNGGACSAASACPGGACTGGAANCSSNVCHGGLRDGELCGESSDPACTSVVSTSGWSVVFRGNFSTSSFQSPNWHYRLRGDDTDGCMKVCSFSLGATGAINTSGLSCSLTPSCGGLETFHYVELRDPNGEIVAIPTVGPATLVNGLVAVEGDPAKTGDCSHPANPTYCP